ncbi:MAG: VIT1/CCC1 transporter family protein [Candidatus Pacebacteria bacterium]|nr:VIT1/CCC1 transporter family protein [Candidatus Paceibacterota bacterium]
MKKIIHKYLPEFVYGSVDGVVTTVAIITGAVGAGLSSSVIFVLGIANVLADAWSMGSSEYLSSISENQLENNSVNGEDGNQKKPLSKGVATFVSFVLVGLLPILPFLFSIFFDELQGIDIWLSMLCALCAFILIGYIGAQIARVSHIKNILRTVFVGTIAAGISFLVGYLLRGIA